MSAWTDIQRETLVGPVLEALRAHAIENGTSLPPFRLPAMARRLVDGLIHHVAKGNARASEELGRQCSQGGLAMSSFLATGQALVRELGMLSNSREEMAERVLVVSDFTAAIVMGMRQAELENFQNQRDSLERALNDSVARQQESMRRLIQELSTPVVPISDRILLLPLVGQIDRERSQRITQRLLAAVTAHGADIVLTDVTGVPMIDADVAQHLLAAVRGVRLLGARMILVGISSQVARSLIELGVDVGDVVTQASLQRGLELAARWRRVENAAGKMSRSRQAFNRSNH